MKNIIVVYLYYLAVTGGAKGEVKKIILQRLLNRSNYSNT